MAAACCVGACRRKAAVIVWCDLLLLALRLAACLVPLPLCRASHPRSPVQGQGEGRQGREPVEQEERDSDGGENRKGGSCRSAGFHAPRVTAISYGSLPAMIRLLALSRLAGCQNHALLDSHPIFSHCCLASPFPSINRASLDPTAH